MTDFLADTPFVGRHWCPSCEPDADPIRETLETRYCSTHEQRTGGTDDGAVAFTFLGGNTEAGGEGNRLLCDWLHRGVIA